MKNILKKFLCAAMVAAGVGLAGQVVKAQPVTITITVKNPFDVQELWGNDATEWSVAVDGKRFELKPAQPSWSQIGDTYSRDMQLDDRDLNLPDSWRWFILNNVAFKEDVTLISQEPEEEGNEVTRKITFEGLRRRAYYAPTTWNATVYYERVVPLPDSSGLGCYTPKDRGCPGAPKGKQEMHHPSKPARPLKF